VTARCPTCKGSLLTEHDYDQRRNVTRCMLCGREPREETTMATTNGDWRPTKTTLADVEAATKPAPAATAAADPLSLYTQVARRLLTAAEAHRAAIVAVEKAAAEVNAALDAHLGARAKLDAALGVIETVRTRVPAETKPPARTATGEKPIGVCKVCGNSRPLNLRGTCAKCWGDRMRKTAQVTAPAEVA
jgi:hypothetical protein